MKTFSVGRWSLVTSPVIAPSSTRQKLMSGAFQPSSVLPSKIASKPASPPSAPAPEASGLVGAARPEYDQQCERGNSDAASPQVPHESSCAILVGLIPDATCTSHDVKVKDENATANPRKLAKARRGSGRHRG